MCWLRGFPKEQLTQQNKPEWHKTAFRTFIIQIWSCTVKAFKPVPAVAEHKPLCFLKHQEAPAKTDSAPQKQTLTVKTFSGCPRALMLVSWICLRIIQASSCFPTWQEGERGRRGDKFTGSASASLIHTRKATVSHFKNRAYCTLSHPFDFPDDGPKWGESRHSDSFHFKA